MYSNDTVHWSLRRHLIIGLTLILGVILTILFLILDYQIDDEVYAQMDKTLTLRARSIADRLLSDQAPDFATALPEYATGGHTEFFTIYDRQGNAVLVSPNSRGVALPRPGQHSDTLLRYNVTLPDGHHGRAIALHQRYPDTGQTYLLVVASERESWDRSERHLHFVLLAAIVLATVAAVTFCILLLKRVFDPLIETGRRLAMTQMPDRTHVAIGKGLPKELAPFAAAFNTGTQRLYDAIERERHFSRDIAHELRTPLSEIRTSAESALRETDPAHAQKSLITAISATERMNRAIDTLLALARYESGQATPAIDPLDLVHVFNTVADEVHRNAERRRTTIELTAPTAAWVRSDIGIVERIVFNLLQNAVEYAPAPSTIACRITENPEGTWLEIDNLTFDLEADDIASMGQRFWRKAAQGGTAQHAGLGLALSNGLAQALHLTLRFQWSEGHLSARLGAFPTV